MALTVKMTTYLSRRSRYASPKNASLFFCLFFSQLAAFRTVAIAKGKPPNDTEKGKVVAVRVDEHTDYVPISPTDSKGRTHGGEAFVHRNQVYRVETDGTNYELEGGKDPTMNVGDELEFRIERGTAYVRVGKKEKKYRVTLTAPKPYSR